MAFGTVLIVTAIVGRAAAAEIEALERFVLSANRSDISQFFIPGTEDFLYYSLMRLINSGQTDSSEFQSLLSAFQTQGDWQSARKIRLRSLLRQWDTTSSPSARRQVLDALNQEFLYYDLSGARSSQTISADSPYPSSLPAQNFTISDSVYNDFWAFSLLKPFAYELLDVRKFSPYVLSEFLNQADLSEFPYVPEAIARCLETNQIWIGANVYRKLSAEQVKALGDLSPRIRQDSQWVEALLEKAFPLEDWRNPTKVQLQTTLEAANSYISSLLLENYEQEISRRLLILSLFTERFTEELFIRYITLRNAHYYTGVYSQYLSKFDRSLPSVSEGELDEEYFSKFLVKTPISQRYSAIYAPGTLASMVARANLLAGKSPNDYNLNAQAISQLANEVELEVERSSQDKFDIASDVYLKIRRKNIPKLTITVTELNPEAYYRSTLSPLPSDLNLDGVVSTQVKVVEYSDSPLVRAVETVAFPELANRPGLFIVDFLGGGRNARALVRKGGLKYAIVQTVAGTAVFVYSGDGGLVRDGSAGVVLDGKTYRSFSGNDYVLLPFAQKPSKKAIIVVGSGLAELVTDFQHEGEQYSLRVALIAQQESLISDEFGAVVLSPKLYINGFQAVLDILEHPAAKVTLSDTSGMSNTKAFPDLSLGGMESSVRLDFEVPIGLAKITVELSAEVVQTNTGKRIPLSASAALTANDQTFARSLFDLYLRSSTDAGKNQYEVAVLGKNGEGIPNVTIDLHMETVYSLEQRTATLSSNSQGVALLGELPHVRKLRVVSRGNPSVFREWDLTFTRAKVALPGEIVICPQDTLDIPVVRTDAGLRLVTVTSEDSVISQERLPAGFATNSVRIRSLVEGLYRLKVPTQEDFAVIALKVVAGAHLSNHILLGERKGFVDTAAQLPVGLGSAKVEQGSLSLQLSGAGSGAKVKVLLRNFIEDTPSVHWESLRNLRGLSSPSVSFASLRSEFLRSRKLDDELRYIIDRKTAKDKRGISYPLPSLLLKPQELEETVTDVQKPQDGTEFEPASPEAGGESDSSGNPQPWSYSSAVSGQFHDFLSSPGAILSEVSADSLGQVTLTDPRISQYSIFELIITNRDAFSVIVFSGKRTEIGKKDIRLSSALDGMKKFAEVRKIQPMTTGQRVNLRDIGSSTFASIDSVGKLLRVLIQLRESTQNTQVSSRDWLFLGNWGGFTQSEKESAYSDFLCHELNLFLYYKDRPFFDSVIRPFLIYKLEKTFIDDFLLGNPLKKYETLEEMSKMAVFELALLARSTNNWEIPALLRDRKQANEQTAQESRWLFDSVLRIALGDTAPVVQPAPKSQPPMEPHVSNTTSASPADFSPPALPESAPSSFPPMPTSAPVPDGGTGDRGKNLPYFLQLDSTREYAETQYVSAPEKPADAFWNDVAKTQGVLLAESVVQAYGSIGEIVMAVGLTDLPWVASVHPMVSHAHSLEMTLASNCLVFHKDIQSVAESPLDSLALVQFFSDPMEKEERVGEFVRTKVYQTNVIVTNMAARKETFEVLMQIPQGSVPLGSFLSTKVETVTIPAYSTHQLQSLFYFPASGPYVQASVYVAVAGKVVRSTVSSGGNVLERGSKLNLDSFTDIARAGNTTAVLNFLNKKNLQDSETTFDLLELNWLLTSQQFFQDVTSVLRKRLFFSESVWAFSLLHASVRELRELLSRNAQIRATLGPSFNSSLVETGREDFRHLEYFPLVNARVHPLGDSSRIANKKFRATYKAFLQYLADKDRVAVEDRLQLALYFALQNRFADSEAQVHLLAPFSAQYQLQFDYLQSYFNTSYAKSVLPTYTSHPISHWRDKFLAVQSQIEEAEQWLSPKSVAVPVLSVAMNGSTIQIYSENVTTATIKLHQIDLEVVFSRSPFLSKSMGACEYTAPVYTETVNLTSFAVTSYQVPAIYRNSNQFLVVESPVQKWSQLSLSSGLRVQQWEQLGELKVMEGTYKPVRGAYVKVYAKRTWGETTFYKDGYTDERGKFAYASLSTDDLLTTSLFSILISDAQLGATVLEVRPPST